MASKRLVSRSIFNENADQQWSAFLYVRDLWRNAAGSLRRRLMRCQGVLPGHEKPRKQLGLGLDAQFGVEVATVDFYGLCRQFQFAGDLFVGKTT